MDKTPVLVFSWTKILACVVSLGFWILLIKTVT